MPKRKPHEDEAISGRENVEKYFETYENKAKTHFTKFLKQLDDYDLNGEFLEIGSGPRILTAIMLKKFPNAQFHALELSADMINIAKKYLERKGYSNSVHFIEGNVYDENLMKSLGNFDFVYSTYLLHHWQDSKNNFRIIYSIVIANSRFLEIITNCLSLLFLETLEKKMPLRSLIRKKTSKRGPNQALFSRA